MLLLAKPPDSTLTSEIEQPERKRTKINFSPRAHLCSDISLLWQRQRFISPSLWKPNELLHLRFWRQVQISLIDIKAVMIAPPRTRWRATTGHHVPAAIAWHGPWIYGGQARLCPSCCIAIFFSYSLEDIGIHMDHAGEGDLIFICSSR